MWFFFSLQNALWQASNCLGRWKLSPMSAMDQKTETHIWPVWLQKHEQLFRQSQADVSLQFSTLWEQGLCPFYSRLCPQCVAECLVLCLTNHRCSITSWGMNEWGLSFGVETWLQGPTYTHHHSRALGLLFPGLSRSSESLSLDLQEQLTESLRQHPIDSNSLLAQKSGEQGQVGHGQGQQDLWAGLSSPRPNHLHQPGW